MSPGRTERGELATWPGVRRAGPRQGQSPALTPGQRRRRRRLDIQWKLYEFGGHFYRGRPKDGSIRLADLPSFLTELLTWHKTQIKGRRCTCRKFEDATGPTSGTSWCTGEEYTFLQSRR